MALSMNKADIAISNTGLNDIEKQVRKETLEACQVCSVDGEEFKDMVKTIRTYWSGEDCEAFISDLKVAAKELYEIVSQINTQIQSGLEKYKEEFTTFQRNNYKAGSTKIR